MDAFKSLLAPLGMNTGAIQDTLVSKQRAYIPTPNPTQPNPTRHRSFWGVFHYAPRR